MNLSIFGLGYVGCVTAACLARDGHHVIGVDVNQAKVEGIQKGLSPIMEPRLDDLIRNGVQMGRIEATQDVAYAVGHSQLLMICVGTPSKSNGDLDATYVERVCRQIGEGMKDQSTYQVVIARSTMLPGTAQDRLLPLLEEASSKVAGRDFGFCINPEFLREGSAIADFDDPPYTLIGQLDERSGDSVASLYNDHQSAIYRVPLGVAEMVKYANNAFHALKVVFANEIGNVCQSHGIDSHQVMDIFAQDTKLNLSPYYLKPGFAFGGSCLGKDLRALLYTARQRDEHLPVLEAILPSNHLQTEKALKILLDEGKRKVGLIGLSFKPDTDDLRESPSIELVERMIGKGFELYIYDREVSLSKLHGNNRVYIDKVIPHIGLLIQPSLEETVLKAEVIVVSKRLSDEERDRLLNLLRPEQTLIDLVRLDEQSLQAFGGKYRGISW